MKTIITSLFLLLCFNLSAQWKPSVSHDYKSNESVPFKDIPQSEINLGIHKFGKQHRNGNHLIIAGIVSSALGGLFISKYYRNSPTESIWTQGYGTAASGIFFTTLGAGLTTAGFIVNIDSFKHLK